MTAMPNPENSTAQKPPLRHKKLLIVLSIILAFFVALVSAFFIMVKIGESKLRNGLVAGEKLETVGDGIDDNAIYHDGKAYYYNENLINILLIGVDKNKDNKKTQGQADALYLISVDTESNKVKIVSISRNTLCEVDVLDVNGEAFGTEEQQICLAYSYGKDDNNSSQNCVKAVSKFLYNTPVNGYYTIHLNSISDIVNLVGGVAVTIPQDANNTKFADKIGQTVTLRGEDALYYLKMRGDSNAPRVERHKEFIKGFISSAKSAVKKDVSLPFKAADRLSKDAVTDINISSMIYLATEALNWNTEFINISGEYGIKDNLEIFTPNEENLKETILNSFYISK